MNATPDSFVVNSCQYTPVYLIQDPGASQGQSYFIAQSNVEEPKPVSDNLKSFYESSGNIENNVVNVNSSLKPRIVKKQDSGVVGNNLKLASFLLPKNENIKQQYLMNSMVVKPNVSLNSASGTITCSTTYATANNTRLNIDSKIVKLKDVALKARCNRIERVPQPKTHKPKDIVTAAVVPIPMTTVQVPLNIASVPTTVISTSSALPSKHTSVQLLKLGETYHSLNQLSDEQMKMVTQALKIFNNPDKIAPEPTYDPVTNTKYIYKVVSPRDLTVVGKNKLHPSKLYEARIENIMTNELRKEIIREKAKKEYLREAAKRVSTLKFDTKKESTIKFDTKKESTLKFDTKKESTFKFDTKKESLFKGETKKEILFRAEAKKDSILKVEAKRDTMLKADINKDSMSKTDAKKETMFNTDLREGMPKCDFRKEIMMKPEQRKDITARNELKREIMRKSDEEFVNEVLKEQEAKAAERTKVTRSGRKVKLPKPILPEGTPHKPKKKTTLVSCFQCDEEFNSLYRLHKHYESQPTHIPSKIHSNLFHCLVAIVKSGTDGDQTKIFVQQLEQLIVKLRSLMPCLLTSKEDVKQCTVNDDVGRLLGLYPGKYRFDIDSLGCVKNSEGFCHHNKPSPPPSTSTEVKEETNPQQWTTSNENVLSTSELETEDCARINSVEKWPTVNKRVWKQKHKNQKAKRMRLASENNDTFIELGTDDFGSQANNSPQCPAEFSELSPLGDKNKADSYLVKEECNNYDELPSVTLASGPESLNLSAGPEQTHFLNTDPTSELEPDTALRTANLKEIAATIANLEDQNMHNNHLQFHSAHFDIRSSPIKPTSTVFRKFQINPELLAKYETQTIQSIETVDKDHETSGALLNDTENLTEIPPLQNDDSTQLDKEHSNDSTDVLVNDDTLQEIFRDDDLSAVKESFILDRELKEWILNRSNDEKSVDGFGKSNSLIEPSLIHVNDLESKSINDVEIGHKNGLPPGDSHDESSVLNFLDTLGTDCLSYPGTEIRTNGDFQLDLFSFHSS